MDFEQCEALLEQDGLERVAGYMLAKLKRSNTDVDRYVETDKQNKQKRKWTSELDNGFGHYTYPV